jgi:heme exporter protein B
MAKATTAILNGEGARVWMALLVSYDLVFTTACLLLFETVLNAE